MASLLYALAWQGAWRLIYNRDCASGTQQEIDGGYDTYERTRRRIQDARSKIKHESTVARDFATRVEEHRAQKKQKVPDLVEAETVSADGDMGCFTESDDSNGAS